MAHNAYRALAGVDAGHARGIERRQLVMATWNEGQPDSMQIDGVCMFKMCRTCAELSDRLMHPGLEWADWRKMQHLRIPPHGLVELGPSRLRTMMS